MQDQDRRYARVRHTATGALAALAAVGAIAGTVALAATPRAKPHANAAAANGGATKTPPPGVSGPDKTRVSQPAVNQEPFLKAVQELVDNGTITRTEGQAVDREIVAGRVDTDTLTSSGFTPIQLQAIHQALANVKRALAPSVR